jgi:hypothetical protein
MPQRARSVLNEVLPPEDRVIEAVVARYQRVAPAVTRFARTLADNESLVVRLGSQAAGGTEEIVIDPGVFQSAYSRSAPVTPAEVALTSALHEVVHLIATDFDEPRPIPPEWIPDDPAPAEAGDGPLTSPLDLFSATGGPEEDDPDGGGGAPGGGAGGEEIDRAVPVPLLDALAEAGGPAAEALFFSLEDARQERVLLAGYAGVRSVLADLYRSAAPHALREARPLGQYALACFLLTGGYTERTRLERRLAPHVAAAVDEATDCIDEVCATDDPWDVGGVALRLLEIAIRHGVVQPADASDSPAATRAKAEADRAAIADTVDAVRLVTPPLQDADAYDQTRQAAQSVAAQRGRAGEAEQAGDPATDQVVRISEAPTVYLPTGQSGKLLVCPFPHRFAHHASDGRQLLEEAALRWQVAQRRVAGELYPLFLANQRRGLRSGYDAGDLSPYAALLLGAGLYERMFERRDLPSRRSYAVSLLVDGSASMLQARPSPGGRNVPWPLAAATLGAWTLANLCDELQIDFEVALFNRAFAANVDDTEQVFSDRRHAATGALRRSQGGAAARLTRTVNHYLLKPFDTRWRASEDILAGLFWMAAAPAEAGRVARLSPEEAPPLSMFDKAANVDEYNVAYATRRLAGRNVSTRILVVLADGMTRGSVEDLAASVFAAEGGGTIVLGIGIGDDTVQAAYHRNQVVERPDDLARAMVDGVRSTLYRSIAAAGGKTWWVHTSGRAIYDQPMRRSIDA